MTKASIVKGTHASRKSSVLKKAIDSCPMIQKQQLKDNRKEQKRVRKFLDLLLQKQKPLKKLLQKLQQDEIKLQQVMPDNNLKDGKGSGKERKAGGGTSGMPSKGSSILVKDGKPSSSKKSKAGRGKGGLSKKQKPDYNGTVLDALSDVFHGSLLAKLPTHSLIIFSMVSIRAKELVDTAPRELDLWSATFKTSGRHCLYSNETSEKYWDKHWQKFFTPKSPCTPHLLPRIKAALILACKCQMCKKLSSRHIIAPFFPVEKRVLCKNCLGDCTVDVHYVTKHLNVLEVQKVLLHDLPFVSGSYSKHVVLKEAVAGLYATSWELFVQGSPARRAQLEMDQIQKQKLLKAKTQEGYSFAKRLAKFWQTSADEKYFRITPSGTPLGLLLGTPTFLKVQELDAKETKKTLYALEHGSSNALSSFQKQLAQELQVFERGLHAEIIYQEIWKVQGARKQDFSFGPFQFRRDNQDFKHQEDIIAVIEDEFIGTGKLAPFSSCDLGIVVTRHDVSKAGAYKIGDSETAKKAWKDLFESLQRKLLQRLKSANSFCNLGAQGASWLNCCSFCKSNKIALEAS